MKGGTEVFTKRGRAGDRQPMRVQRSGPSQVTVIEFLAAVTGYTVAEVVVLLERRATDSTGTKNDPAAVLDVFAFVGVAHDEADRLLRSPIDGASISIDAFDR